MAAARFDEESIRTERYRTVATQKRQQAIRGGAEGYYARLVREAEGRTDLRAIADKKQINKDLPRTFHFLPPVHGPGGEDALLPCLWRLLLACVERGRSLSAKSTVGRRPSLIGVDSGKAGGAGATTPRGLLEGYPQGLNFLAGMSLLCAGGASWDGSGSDVLEENAFWLLAMLLEDVLDPDFFGADVKHNLQMAYIGGLGMKNMTVDLAETHCPSIFEALGPEAFRSCLGAILDKWVLSLFIGCAPHRLIQYLWDHLILPSPYHDESSANRLPSGLGCIIAFSLAGLVCCGEFQLRGSRTLQYLLAQKQQGATAEDLSLEAAEAIQTIHKSLSQWPADQDAEFLNVATGILVDLAESGCDAMQLWSEVRKRKQRIADCTDNYDEQLMCLAKRTHFTVQEIGRLRSELENFQARRRDSPSGTSSFSSSRSRTSSQVDDGLSLDAFTELVRRAVPEFPSELCARLFNKLDAFNVGQLAFAELACGMSALSLGTMDEKLQVCFDIFDSEGQRALKLKDLGELCTVLFRVALKRGLEAAKVPSTDDVLLLFQSNRAPPSPPSAPAKPRGRMSMPGSTNLGHHMSYLVSPMASRDTSPSRCAAASGEPPWRAMLLRLLSVAQVRTPGGPWLVAFEDFRSAAHMEPALLCLFSWCLPRPPEVSGPAFELSLGDQHVADSCCCHTLCNALRGVFSRMFGRRDARTRFLS